MTPAIIANDAQRFLGLTLFVLLFIQLILGVFMDKIKKKLGGWVFNFHVTEGIVIYVLAVFHPLAFMAFNHFIGGTWNPYAAFINVCLLCNATTDFYNTLGIISFWLLTTVAIIAIFRHYNSWFKANWRKFHLLNYLIFLIAGLHAFLLGTDFSHKPFVYFAVPAYAIVVGIVLFIELPRFYRNFTAWVRS